jgi:hypothetical protein
MMPGKAHAKKTPSLGVFLVEALIGSGYPCISVSPPSIKDSSGIRRGYRHCEKRR